MLLAATTVRNRFSDDPKARCTGHKCGKEMSDDIVRQILMEYVLVQANGSEGENGGGFVKGVVTYTITDDLVVAPMSAISCVALLNNSGGEGIGCFGRESCSGGNGCRFEAAEGSDDV